MIPAFAFLALAVASAPVPQTRSPSAAELKSFQAYYHQRFAEREAGTPVFAISRADAKQAWTIGASVDAPAKRGFGALCRMERIDFSFAGRWSDTRRSYAWMEHAGCANKERAVELLEPVPDVDLLALLELQLPLLERGRILLSGNTACASKRAYRFALDKVTVGSAGPNPEVMAGLMYKRDHNTMAKVWVKRSGLEYTARNVSCP
jgi:hypothetical protein